ncbi:MAG: hypothetical protein JWM64_597, partial [Frankiales bacterium]|nr:hypothetical protein [Frankiales bacterium]
MLRDRFRSARPSRRVLVAGTAGLAVVATGAVALA